MVVFKVQGFAGYTWAQGQEHKYYPPPEEDSKEKETMENFLAILNNKVVFVTFSQCMN